MEENREVDTKKKSMSFLVVCLVSIIIVMGGVILYLLLYGNMGTQELDSNESKQTTKLEEVYLTGEEAYELLGYVPIATPYGGGTDAVGVDMYYTAFSNEKVMVSDMNVNWLLHNTLWKMRMNHLEKDIYPYSTGEAIADEYLSKMYYGKTTMQIYGGGDCTAYAISDIQKELESRYGKAGITLPEKIYGDVLTECTKKDSYYICKCANGGYATSDMSEYFGTWSGDSTLVREYEKAQKDDQRLYLFFKFAKVDFKNITDDNQMTFQVYKDRFSKELITDTAFNAKDYYEQNSSKGFIESIYNQFKDKMDTYKVTYKMNGAHYILESVEPVK
jgi:hypothetical protein